MVDEGRRKFLEVSLGAIGVSAAAAVAYPVYRYLAPAKGAGLSTKVTIPESELAEGEAKFFQYAGSSAVVVRKSNGQVVALSAVCTHLGCIVQWRKQQQDFLCPCHGGEYSVDGAVLAGPPPKPLPKLPLTVDNGVITVG